MQIFIGADYRGFELKSALINCLASLGYRVNDEGAYGFVEGDDFNDPAIRVSLSVRENPGAKGILICGSGHGMTMQANRFKGIRAALCGSTDAAKKARLSDDANVLCLADDFTSTEDACEIAKVFLSTNFEPIERRVRRINRLDEGDQYD